MWRSVFVPELSVAEKIVRSVLVYLFLVIVAGIAGRRQLAQSEFVPPRDAHDAGEYGAERNDRQRQLDGRRPDRRQRLLFVNYLVVRFLYRRPEINRLLEGGPVPLIRDGKIIREHLAKEAITRKS